MPREQSLYNRPLPGARLNMAHPIARDIQGCWLLNEQMGLRAMDLSPYANHGILTNFPDGQRAFNGLLFDGSNDFVSIAHEGRLGPDFAPLEAIFIPAALSAGHSICSKGYVGGAPRAYRILIDTDQVYFEMSTDGTNAPSVSSGSATAVAGRFYHCIGTYDGAILRFYWEGRQTSTASAAGTMAKNTEALQIGRDRTTNYFSGSIFLVRLWRRAISAWEVAALVASPYKPLGIPMFL